MDKETPHSSETTSLLRRCKPTQGVFTVADLNHVDLFALEGASTLIGHLEPGTSAFNLYSWQIPRLAPGRGKVPFHGVIVRVSDFEIAS